MENMRNLTARNGKITHADATAKRDVALARRTTALPRPKWVVMVRGGKTSPRAFVMEDKQRFQREMRLVRTRLRGIVTETEVKRWLQAPNNNLRGLTPTTAIEQGQMSLVLEMIIRVEEGIYV